MTHATCRPTAKYRDQLRISTLGNRVWTTLIICRAWFTKRLSVRPLVCLAHRSAATGAYRWFVVVKVVRLVVSVRQFPLFWNRLTFGHYFWHCPHNISTGNAFSEPTAMRHRCHSFLPPCYVWTAGVIGHLFLSFSAPRQCLDCDLNASLSTPESWV